MEDIETLINHISGENYSQANAIFNDLIADRLNSALDQERISVASQMFGNSDDEEQLEMDFDEDEEEDIDEDDSEEDEE